MFERFNDQARAVVVRSRHEARQLHHPYIGTEHLLLALLVPEAGVPYTVIRPDGDASGYVARRSLGLN